MGLSVGLYLLAATVAFFPCLFLGQAYFDNDLLAQFGPWRAFLKDQLAQGHFPLWNPYLMGGTPFFADLQNMMLYPFNWLTLPFSVPMGLTVFFFIHMVWAALGMHLWLRALGLSKNACRVGALLFSLSGFFWLEIIHPPVLAAFAWLPWVFLSLEGLANKPKPLNGFWAGLCFAMLFLCGSPQVTLGAFYGGLAYFLFRYFKNETRLTPRSFLTMALFLMWGALPLLGQLIPTMEFAKLSDRSAPDAQTEKVNDQLSLRPAALLEFIFPRMNLKEGEDMAVALQSDKDAPDFPFAGNWGYLGTWFLVFLVGAWRHKEKRGLTVFLSTFAVLTLVFCFGRHTPFHSFVSELLPGLSLIRVPYRFLYAYVLAGSALAALGWSFLFDASSQSQKNSSFRNSPLIYVWMLLLVSFEHLTHCWREIPGLVLGLAGYELFLHTRFKQTGQALFLAAIALPLLLNGWGDFEIGPSSNFDFAGKSKAIVTAADSVKPGRLIFMTNEMYYPIEVGGKKYVLNYPQNAACALGIKNFGGYNPLVLKAKRDISRLFISDIQPGAIGGFLTQTDHGTIPGFKKQVFPPYIFYRTLEPPSFVFAYNNFKNFSMFPPFSVPFKLEKDELDFQKFLFDLKQDTRVVFTETMYPGWKAWVNGQPITLSTANNLFRALDLSAGYHEVEFKFEPWWWTPIRIGLAFWLLITLVAFLVLLRRNFFALLQKVYYSIGGHGLGRIKVLRWAYDILFKLFKPKSVMVQGHRMWLDDRDTLQLAVNQVYEPAETALLKEHLKAGQTFIDVGANIGYYTLLAARIVGPKGKVYAFEPDLNNFKLLVRNIAANGYSNVVPMNQALSNKAGTARLYINPSNRGDHRIYDSHDGRPSVEVGMTTLDRFFEKLDKKVHFIKMDIQGAEAAALGGMKGLIRKNKGLKLVTEFSPGSLKAFGADPKKYLKNLQALGFRFLEISEKAKTVKPVTPTQLLKRQWGGSEDYTNLFCIK